MNIPAGRKVHELIRQKRVLDAINEIENEAESTEAQLAYDKSVQEAKKEYACARIQGLIRGFLDRLVAAQKRLERHAAGTINALLRGRLGRKRWMYEYWKKISVVKSEDGLKDILERSTCTRESKDRKEPWKEFFDPLTNSFWYYDPKTKLNTWECPLQFQRNLVCCWEGYHQFGGLPSQPKCRMVFDSTIAYQNHMRTAHRWYCSACDTSNPGIVFPKCSLCGNTLSGDGINAEEVVQSAVSKLQFKLYQFLLHDKATEKTGYKLKDRIIKKTLDARQKERTDKVIANTVAEEVKMSQQDHSDPLSSTISLLTDDEFNRSFELKLSRERRKKSVMAQSRVTMNAPMISDVNTSEGTQKLQIITEGSIIDNVSAQFSPLATNASTSEQVPLSPSLASPEGLIAVDVAETPQSGDFVSPKGTRRRQGIAVNIGAQTKDLDKKGKTKAQIKALKKQKNAIELALAEFKQNAFLYEDIDQKVKEGIIPPTEFEKVLVATSDAAQQELAANAVQEEISVESSQTAYNLGMEKGDQRLQVCKRFQRGACSKAACPFAHPGLRDSAEVNFIRIPSTMYKVPYVLICAENLDLKCELGSRCPKYHVYVRPSTEKIIRSLYQKSVGDKFKTFKSGATLDGEVYDDKYNGKAVMTWPNGSTYVGSWKNDLRHGIGIFRTTSGIEYIGEFEKGVKHGFGVLRHPNGEEYVGEFFEGRMEGVGRLSSASGDIYEGQFERNKYNGIGIFTTKVGNKYMGHMKDGKAHGLGVQVMLNGQKYKGYFDANHRHGKGVCSYKNGSKYAGDWYRGVHEGFGVYVSPINERYIGQWRASKKHGNGRYYFENGDFYDGEFKLDLAAGKGAYYSHDGNVYYGMWENDMRNGRGTYVFNNGSRYTGNWVDNDIHGKGKFDYANGCYYRGEFDRNRKHGKGIFTWANLNCFKGEFVHDEMRGKGEMKYQKGHRYIGDWAGNKKNGYGIFYYADGHIYEGHWVDDQRVGKGKMTFFPGLLIEESYDGDWVDDQKHGRGKYAYRKDEGTIYDGDWVWGTRHGEGKITYADGSFYRGEFKQEQMWGKGVYISKEGAQYEGDWVNNMRHGVGTLMSSDGSIYQGEFWANMKQGKGFEIRVDGTKYEGIWDCGLCVGEGRSTIQVGQGANGGPTQITVKCFSF